VAVELRKLLVRIGLKVCVHIFVFYLTVCASYPVDIRALETFKAQWLLHVPPGLTFTNSTFCPRSVFMCFVWISEQTAIISLYSINGRVFITETECVYCAVRTGSSFKAQWLLYVPPGLTFPNSTFCPHSVFMCFVWISEQTVIMSLYSINPLKMKRICFI
jgi:hypothetical protein